MAVLGKRKAPKGPSISAEDANAIFQRHFESQFFSLPGAKANKAAAADGQASSDSGSRDDDDESEGGEGSEDEQGQDDDEWGGLSEDEAEDETAPPVVEVVDHSSTQLKPTTMSKRELKAFMSSRPPDQTSLNTTPDTANPSTSSSSTPLPEDAPSLLAQDLELRRLLAESHLLAPSRPSTNNAAAPKSFAAGRTRQKATDLRVQALGSKVSIHKQEKMPMNMRKGIVATASARETKRRREAKENGIILERETSKKPKRSRGRDSGVDRPGVGRLRGSELRLNERDVRSIESGRDAFGRRGR